MKVYVASSWRNLLYDGVIATLRAANLDLYDFKNPPNSTGFSWQQVGGQPLYMHNTGQGAETAENYLRMIGHPRAVEGYHSDIDALLESDTVVLVLPCGRSAHLELGIAVGAGKRTAILLTETLEPELMYKAVDFMTTSVGELLVWLGVEYELLTGIEEGAV
jgi:hypothetical protein